MQNQNGNQSSLPIVNMHDLRMPRQKSGKVNGRFGEEDEAFAIIGVVDSVLGIESGPIVVAWLLNEINGHPWAVLQRPNVGALAEGTQREIHVPGKRGEARKLFANSAIERGYDSDLMPCPPQRFTQSPGHIPQPATFA